VVNYNDCISIESLTHGPDNPEYRWNTECPDHHAVVSVETEVVEEFMWTISRTQCCALVDKITTDGARIPEEGYLVGGGSFAVEDEWDVQCEPNAIMVGLYDNDDSGDFDDIDTTKCRTLDSTFACGDKIDNSDCVVVDLLPNALSSCPIDYVLVGLYDDEYTSFNRVRKMKCCRVLQCIQPTVSPTHKPTAYPTSSIPTYFPTTTEPTYFPTTDEPTSLPTSPPTHAPTICEPTCRSHTDQMVDLLGRILDFNRELLNLAELKGPATPLHTVLNEMMSDLETLEHQMNIVPGMK